MPALSGFGMKSRDSWISELRHGPLIKIPHNGISEFTKVLFPKQISLMSFQDTETQAKWFLVHQSDFLIRLSQTPLLYSLESYLGGLDKCLIHIWKK